MLNFVFFCPCLLAQEVNLRKLTDEAGKDISGDRQSELVGHKLSRRFVIEAYDENNAPLSGIPIVFKIVSQPKSVKETARISPQRTITDIRGQAMARLTLGSKKGNYVIIAYSDKLEAEPIVFHVKANHPAWLSFVFIGLIGGVGVFLYGMRLASDGLQKASSRHIKLVLGKLTNNRFFGLLIGVILTLIMQSSSATTAMLVGFANATLMTLKQTIGVILGAGIGSTMTVQLIAFRVTDYALVIVAVGVLMMFLVKGRILQYVGQAILGFGFIFFGMKVMGDAVNPLKSFTAFSDTLLLLSKHPILLLIIAAAFTTLIQSSAATIGLALALSMQGAMNIYTALPIILGANVGTCITGFLASIGASQEARRVAMCHLVIKSCGVIVVLPFLSFFGKLMAFISVNPARQIANAHTFFNVINACMFLPFTAFLSTTMIKLFPAKETVRVTHLDDQVLQTPALAIGQATRETLRMAGIVQDMVNQTFKVFSDNDEKLLERLRQRDNEVDVLNKHITHYLTHITQESLTEEQSRKEIDLLYIVKDLEHIGDVIDKNLMENAKKKIESGFSFSKEGLKEIDEIYKKVSWHLEMAIDAFASGDTEIAKEVVCSKVEIDALERQFRQTHIGRLHTGLKESIATSAIHLDIINNYRRINTHISNIARVILEANHQRKDV